MRPAPMASVVVQPLGSDAPDPAIPDVAAAGPGRVHSRGHVAKWRVIGVALLCAIATPLAAAKASTRASVDGVTYGSLTQGGDCDSATCLGIAHLDGQFAVGATTVSTLATLVWEGPATATTVTGTFTSSRINGPCTVTTTATVPAGSATIEHVTCTVSLDAGPATPLAFDMYVLRLPVPLEPHDAQGVFAGT